MKQGYGNTMMQVEGQVKTRTEEIYKKDNEIYELKVSFFATTAMTYIFMPLIYDVCVTKYSCQFLFGFSRNLCQPCRQNSTLQQMLTTR